MMDKIEKYPMGDSQLAQIDCRDDECLFHANASCNNISPAITLGPGRQFTCWSKIAVKAEEEIPFHQRSENVWMFCDCHNTGSDPVFLGEVKEDEPLFWCPNCSETDDRGRFTGEPVRLCESCFREKMADGERNKMCGFKLPDGKWIDYFVPLEERDRKKWIERFRNRSRGHGRSPG